MNITNSHEKVLILHDGGSLMAFKKKGNLNHYVEALYNPGNYFDEAHILVFDRIDLKVPLRNPTLRVHYLNNISFESVAGRFGRYVGRGLSLPWMLLQMIRIIRREKITIIRARNAYLAGLLSVLASKLTRVPVVVSLGGDNRIAQELLKRYYTYSKYLSYSIEEFSLKNADRVFCTNEFTRQYAIRLGVLPEKSSVVPHRIDTAVIGTENEFASRQLFGFGNRPMVLFIGRFEPDKQVDIIIEAIPSILKLNPETIFVFIGDGSLRNSLVSRCVEIGVKEEVIFAGYQTRTQIAKYLAAASVVWIPMSGFVIYEAAVARKAIVAFDVEWHSEFIENNVTGLLVKDRDFELLASAVNSLLADPIRARNLGLKAEKKFQEECDQSKLTSMEVQEYMKVIKPLSKQLTV